eukprot:CAMPEP_0180554066 /NCGR_PEP_ID=MMETSP1036_2-20121128/74727_1 /TAXON_ID=632150 /ORGANISM="Azadinium spinosum, Strain 3D9" /LENGTH=229 /DNA_ID=CAMNT_0022569855 /DNA_START=492 /DNA_END=1181 /DNA_ORIENTATION=+
MLALGSTEKTGLLNGSGVVSWKEATQECVGLKYLHSKPIFDCKWHTSWKCNMPTLRSVFDSETSLLSGAKRLTLLQRDMLLIRSVDPCQCRASSCCFCVGVTAGSVSPVAVERAAPYARMALKARHTILQALDWLSVYLAPVLPCMILHTVASLLSQRSREATGLATVEVFGFGDLDAQRLDGSVCPSPSARRVRPKARPCVTRHRPCATLSYKRDRRMRTFRGGAFLQ